MADRVTGAGLLVVVAAALAGPGGVANADATADLARAVRRAGPAERAAAAAALLVAAPDVAACVAAIRAGTAFPPAVVGWSEQRTPEGRAYDLFAPAAAAGVPVPLCVVLHGGVTVPEAPSRADLAGLRALWDVLGERHGFAVALPYARGDCAWWTDAGVQHVRATVRDAKRHVAVGDDRVVCTGFSDGGTGAWYLAMAAPDPFAACLPMNGSPEVASLASMRQCYPDNLPLTPLFVCHTRDDPLYPATAMMPHWAGAYAAGARMRLHVAEQGGHTCDYFHPLAEAIAAFVTTTVRDPALVRLAWRTAEPALGSARVVEILAVGPGASDAPPEADIVVERAPDPLADVLGLRVDTVPEGMPLPPGVTGPAPPAGSAMVRKVFPGGTAAALGLRPADVIVELDGRSVGSPAELASACAGRKPGAAIRVAVRRFGVAEPVRSAGKVARLALAPAYLRTLPTARLAVCVEGNAIAITSRLVRRVRLGLAPGRFDLTQEVVVSVNGTERHRGVPVPDLRRLVEGYAAEADTGRLWAAVLELAIP